MSIGNISNNIRPADSINNQTKIVKNSSVASEVQNKNFTLNISDTKNKFFSFDLKNINEGIAKTEIMKNSMNKQGNILNNINNILTNSTTQVDKNSIKNSIYTNVKDYNTIAWETSYKNEHLLIHEENNNYINISTQYNSFSIEKPNSIKYSNDIFTLTNENDLNINQNLEKIQNSTKQIINDFNQDYINIRDFSNSIKNSATNSIKEQIDLHNNTDIYSDFSKNDKNLNNLLYAQGNMTQKRATHLLY